MKNKPIMLIAFFLFFSIGMFFLPNLLASHLSTEESKALDLSSVTTVENTSIEDALAKVKQFSNNEQSDQADPGQVETVNRLRNNLIELFQALNLKSDTIILQNYEVVTSGDAVFWQIDFMTDTGTNYGTAMIDEANKKVVRFSYFGEIPYTQSADETITRYLDYLSVSATKIDKENDLHTVTLEGGQEIKCLIGKGRILMNYS